MRQLALFVGMLCEALACQFFHLAWASANFVLHFLRAIFLFPHVPSRYKLTRPFLSPCLWLQIATLVTVGTLAPRFLQQQGVDARSFGPFTPGLEKIVGRVAMMGFFGLVLVEAIKGSALLG